jgi:hypothetical protein
MKVKFFTIAMIMIIGATVLHGQTVITYQNHAPQVGQTITVKTLLEPENVNPGPAGAGVTWDFSDFVGDDEFTSHFVDPAETPFTEQLEGLDVNVAVEIEEEEDFGYSFLKTGQEQTTMNALGFMVEGEPLMFSVFDPPVIVMKYPFAYENSYETYSEYTLDGGQGFVMVTKEWSTSVADAWGTLTNPVATYNDVLRVKTTSIDSSYTYMNGELLWAERYDYTDFAWYSAANRHPVQTMSGEVDGDEIFIYDLDYLVEESANVNELAKNRLTIYPNPASDVLYFENELGQFILSDVTGRKVMEINNTDRAVVSHLPEGLYLLQEVINNQIVSSTKVIIKR